MPLILDVNLFPQVAVIDVEASGLGSRSWPIEIGWCYGDLKTQSFLVRPHAVWDMEGWSPAAEQAHGISIDDCWEQGVDPEEAAQQLNEALTGLHLLADDPVQDGGWIAKLFADTGIKQGFDIHDYEGMLTLLMGQITPSDYYRIEHSIRDLFPYTHRAADDSRSRMAMLCACKYPELLDVWMARRGHSF